MRATWSSRQLATQSVTVRPGRRAADSGRSPFMMRGAVVEVLGKPVGDIGEAAEGPFGSTVGGVETEDLALQVGVGLEVERRLPVPEVARGPELPEGAPAPHRLGGRHRRDRRTSRHGRPEDGVHVGAVDRPGEPVVDVLAPGRRVEAAGAEADREDGLQAEVAAQLGQPLRLGGGPVLGHAQDRLEATQERQVVLVVVAPAKALGAGCRRTPAAAAAPRWRGAVPGRRGSVAR